MADNTAKLKRLYEALRENQAKTYEITEEIGRLLNGEAGIGDVLKGLERDCSALWQARYKTAYIWNYKQDRPAFKRLLKTLAPEEIVKRYEGYVRAGDKFYTDARHGFALFASQVNRFALQTINADEFKLDVDAPADCRHTPRCTTDQQHTTRRSLELRA